VVSNDHPFFMFRMNGMTRAHGRAGAAFRMNRPVFAPAKLALPPSGSRKLRDYRGLLFNTKTAVKPIDVWTHLTRSMP